MRKSYSGPIHSLQKNAIGISSKDNINNNNGSYSRNHRNASKIRKTRSYLQPPTIPGAGGPTTDTDLMIRRFNSLRASKFSLQRSSVVVAAVKRTKHKQQHRKIKKPSSSRWDDTLSTGKKDMAPVSPAAPGRKISHRVSKHEEPLRKGEQLSRWENEQPLAKACSSRCSEMPPTRPRRHLEDDTTTLKSALMHQHQAQYLNHGPPSRCPLRYSYTNASIGDRDSVPKRPSRLVMEESCKRFETESSINAASPPRLLRRRISSDGKTVCDLADCDKAQWRNAILDVLNASLEEIDLRDF